MYTRFLTHALLASAFLLTGCNAVSSNKASTSASALASAPPECPPDTIRLFRASNWTSDEERVSGVSSKPLGALIALRPDMTESVSSLVWNLPPGVFVVLYENRDGSGSQQWLKGSGNYPNLKALSFNDECTCWGRFDVWTSPRPIAAYGLMGDLPVGTVEFWQDREFRGESRRVNVNDIAADGIMYSIRDMGNVDFGITGLRWNLPPGKVLVISESKFHNACDAETALWGKGQVELCSRLGLGNDDAKTMGLVWVPKP